MTSTSDSAETPATGDLDAPIAEASVAEVLVVEPVEATDTEPSGAEPVEATDTEPAPEDGSPDPAAPLVADEVLLGSRGLARAALEEITDAQTIGSDDGHEVNEAHVLTLFFECRLPGYPGWRWAASLARADEEAEPTVLEVELLPSAGAVVAPEWVPWSERLAQYREAQKLAAEEAAASGEDVASAGADEEAEPGELEDALLAHGLEGFDDDEEDAADDDIDDEAEDGLDDDEDDEDDDIEADEDGFSDLDEHDLHDHEDDDLLEDAEHAEHVATSEDALALGEDDEE